MSEDPVIEKPQQARSGFDWRRQFRLPSGPLGALFGHLMVLTNRAINRLAVECLAVGPGDHVLEIGFGHGKLIGDVARRATRGFVAGIDPSATMLRQARRRNRRAIRARRVELGLGNVSEIPYPDGRFDRVCTVNTIYFWPDPPSDLREMRRVLKPGGCLAVAFRKKNAAAGSSPQGPSSLAATDVEELAGLLAETGFDDVQATEQEETAPAWNLTTRDGGYAARSVCVTAIRNHQETS